MHAIKASKAFLKSMNVRAAGSFRPFKPSMIRRRTSICYTVDLPGLDDRSILISPQDSFNCWSHLFRIILLRVFATKEDKLIPLKFLGSLRYLAFFGKGIMTSDRAFHLWSEPYCEV